MYLPARLGDDHLSAELMEFIPQFFVLKVTLHLSEIIAVELVLQQRGKRVVGAGH